jgi:hypothetical protein
MRYLTLLLLTCTPLATLTGWSLWRATSGPAQLDAAAQADNLDTAKKLAEETTARVDTISPVVRELTQTNLLAARPDILSAEPHKTPLGAVVQGWRASVDARRLVRKYADLNLTSPPADAPPAVRRKLAQSRLDKLREFAKAERSNFSEAGDFFSLLDHRAAELESEIAQFASQDLIDEARAQAIDDLNRGRYDACLKALDSAVLAQVTDPELVEQMRTLRKRAEYRRDFSRLDARRPAGAADRDLYNAIGEFLRTYADPPTPAEADLQAKLEARHARLETELAVASLDEVTDLDALLVRASRIVGDTQIEETIRQKARRQVVEWLERQGFPRLQPPDELFGKQEAVTKSGQRKIGIFLLPAGAEQWRFWTEKSHRERARQGDEQISRDSFESPPATPRYVSWADDYNAESEKLIREGGGKADWQQLADRCQTWQKELVAYRQQWGIDQDPDRACRGWTFLDAAATARSVLRHWDEFKQLLGRDP